MKNPADTRRITLARRLACNLPAWAVARASGMTTEALEEVMLERGFDELVSSMAELMAMEEQARLKKLFRIAQEVLANAIVSRDPRACEFMLRQTELKRNPHKTLQRGLNATIKAEMAKAERARAEIDAGTLTPETPPPERPEPFDFTKQPTTLAEAIAACEAAAALPPDRHLDPVDARLYRAAGALRRQMLREEVIHHGVAEHEAAERRNVPLELEEVEAIEAAQVAEHGRRMARQEAEKAPKPAKA
ncbi:MAG: hypothetical protein KF778_23225, partial [Rhodocyclaceae bacterium]|nr:hypothetical protein [Rhodocyclaceae bacterium]